ncbi:MAG TPA: alkaline phosphatase family protein [Bradyrhizobium sp.]|nr:alkaline phosphatase family protein [Bradyrhizobium sp.]
MRKKLLSTVAMFGVATAVAWSAPVAADDQAKTATPIKHLVVIFQENRSFDHYFGTYPNALNVDGEPTFVAAKNTPTVNNLLSSPTLLDNNPNLNPANGAGASNPFRLDRTQFNTADQSHNYSREQQAYDNGLNDLFPLDVGRGTTGGAGGFGTTAQVMGYFDGNTVTALWNYAQNFAMSDNAYTDTFGPSTPGLLNMWAGQTNGATFPVNPSGLTPAQLLSLGIAVPSSDGSLTLIQDIDPAGDVCSNPALQVRMTGQNVGDLLNKANITWGSFVGGFDLQTVNANGSTGCKFNNPGQTGGRSNKSEFGATISDYVPHHIWFEYFASTANPTHAPQSSVQAIGHTLIPGTNTKDPANHAYDLDVFKTAVQAGNFPAVSFIKMAAFQDGHPGNSDPLDEQTALVNLINLLQQQPEWKNTAVIVTYDDSDGQYDHVAPAITSPSFSAADFANGTGNCGTPGSAEPTGLSGQQVAGRCGPGFRIPFVVISPFAKKNFVSHTKITQASVTKFIEDNWLNGERLGGGSFDATTGSIVDMFDFRQGESKLILDPTMGTVVSSIPAN